MIKVFRYKYKVQVDNQPNEIIGEFTRVHQLKYKLWQTAVGFEGDRLQYYLIAERKYKKFSEFNVVDISSSDYHILMIGESVK